MRWSLRRLGDALAERISQKLLERMEDEGELPLEPKGYDVVVDDPEMSGRHEYQGIAAVSAKAAGVEAYRRAMRDEGFRCVSHHPPGDEVTVEGASRDCGQMWATVHQRGKHPAIEYPRREARVAGEERVQATDGRSH